LLAALAGRIYDHAPQQNADPLGRPDMTAGKFTFAQIEGTWNRVMRCDDREFARMARQSGSFQNDLTGFVAGFTLDLPAEVGEHARDMMVALYEIYRDHAASVRSATEAEVNEEWKRSKARIADVEALVAAGNSIDTVLAGHPQPKVLAHVVDMLLERGRDDTDSLLNEVNQEGPEHTDEEFWHVLAVMHTVVAVLESHATHRPAA
jgi:hypothetical protein